MNKNLKNINKHFKQFLLNCKSEQEDYKKVNEIIQKFIKDRNSLSKEDINYLHLKFQDYLKITTSGVIFILPGGSILLPLILRYSKEIGFDINPSNFKSHK
jgi:hypothetical protein